MNVSPTYRSRLQVATLLVLATLLTACGINNIPTLDEQAKAAWVRSRTSTSVVPT